MSYDYKAGKKRIQDILNSKLEVIKKDPIPSVDTLTFDNSYYGWITGIFIDIRNSTSLFQDGDQVKVSKIIKSFTSEVIEILRDSNDLLEIGIRGDCVYAVYSGDNKQDTENIYIKSFFINTLMKMLNKLYDKKEYPQISAGIGVSTSQELIIKAGRNGVGINSVIWIGKAVTGASNLSAYGNKDGWEPIVISSCTYENLLAKNKADLFTKKYIDNDVVYHGDIVASDFNSWIDWGMN